MITLHVLLTLLFNLRVVYLYGPNVRSFFQIIPTSFNKFTETRHAPRSREALSFKNH